MKRIIITAAVMLLTYAAESKNLKALFDYKTFYAPKQGTYVETYLSVIGNSVNYKQSESGRYVASVEVSITIKDAAGVKFADKYNLLSPLVSDTLKALNFVDHHRMPLANGNYVIELMLADKNGDGKPFSASLPFSINYASGIVAISDIEFAESYNKSENTQSELFKNGYEVIPLVDNFFPEASTKLNFYAEVYNTSNVLGNEPLLLHYFIQTAESKKVMNDFSVIHRKNAAEVIPVLSSIGIEALPAGNYQLVINVKNKLNDLLASKEIFFQRGATSFTGNNIDASNSFASAYTDKKLLAENVASLMPLSNAIESQFITNQLKLADVELMQKFFWDFWQKRNASNPEAAWLAYKADVDKVQHLYGTRSLKGYNTDIGRVYLKYGSPDNIERGENEPTSYPYEIWRYQKIRNSSDKYFVFWNKDLLGKNYELLHSNMPGEPYDEQWNFKLHSRTMRAEDYDQQIKKVNIAGDKTQEKFERK